MRCVKCGNISKIRRKKILFFRKRALRSNSYRYQISITNNIKSIISLYKDRENRAIIYQSIWQKRINVRVRFIKIKYNIYIYIFRQKKSKLNRKTLAQLAILNLKIFQIFLILYLYMTCFTKYYIIILSNSFLKIKKLKLVVMFPLKYKYIDFLRQYINILGKIIPRYSNHLHRKKYRIQTKIIRQTRNVRLIPFVWLTY